MSVTVRIATEPSDRAACAAIRTAVFVGEQKVPAELEWDEWDAVAVHFLACAEDGRPAGTARLVDYEGLAKIGRVAVLAEARGRSVGRVLMEAVIVEARRRGFSTAVLGSQVHVIPFFERLGFLVEGAVFMEAGIPHRRMRLSL